VFWQVNAPTDGVVRVGLIIRRSHPANLANQAAAGCQDAGGLSYRFFDVVDVLDAATGSAVASPAATRLAAPGKEAGLCCHHGQLERREDRAE